MLIIVKIGTDSVIGNIAKISKDLAALKNDGHDVVLVSSGAVGFGRKIAPNIGNTPVEKQALASIGQIKLIKEYQYELSNLGFLVSQILITKKDLEGKEEMNNFERMIKFLLSQKNIIPIINENDSIALREIMFTDNDEIAAMVAAFLGADKLIILTNVDGIYDDFYSENRKIIPKMTIDEIPTITSEKSSLGRGGMQSKANVARKLAKLGISTTICKVLHENILKRIADGEELGTTILASRDEKMQAVKRKLAFNVGIKTYGKIVANNCLVDLIQTSKKPFSILPIGLLSTEGEFERGDLIEIYDEKVNLLGYGIARYCAKELKNLIGKEAQKPILRYEYMYIF